MNTSWYANWTLKRTIKPSFSFLYAKEYTPYSLKESFLCVPSFLPAFFVLISPFVQGSQSVLRINVSTQTRRMQETVGLPWEMLRFSCMSFLHKMRDSFSRIKRGFVSFSFQNMAHTAFWTLLGFLASLTQLEAMQKNTTLPHKTFVHSLCKRPNPIKPPGLRLQRVFLQAKREAALPPFLFLCCFYSASKVAVIASLFCTART